MRHFPIFLELTAKRVVVSGAGECAVAKLRLLLKTNADIFVFGTFPTAQILNWAVAQKITYAPREMRGDDVGDAVLVYAANENDVLDAKVAAFGRAAGAIVNIVDNLNDSDFITPAIVDRSPVTIAIGTEGAAPVLARKIKQTLEEMLPTSLGTLARIGQAFRDSASVLPMGRKRRVFWSEFYFKKGPIALAKGGRAAVEKLLPRLLDDTINKPTEIGRVHFMGAGNGDPELLTLKARNILHEADVIIHDPSVPREIMELVRREAILQSSSDIADHMTFGGIAQNHTEYGAQVVRLVDGDLAQNKGISSEITELSRLNVPYDIISGIALVPAHNVFDQRIARPTMQHAGIYAQHSKNININEMVGS
jgi:uroporphyrin-III C-methyltransferase/precorrin-2 dehydrogenase/sirohydrochlorin ferrochelatase